jgi:hypothetical protein
MPLPLTRLFTYPPYPSLASLPLNYQHPQVPSTRPSFYSLLFVSLSLDLLVSTTHFTKTNKNFKDLFGAYPAPPHNTGSLRCVHETQKTGSFLEWVRQITVKLKLMGITRFAPSLSECFSLVAPVLLVSTNFSSSNLVSSISKFI